MKFDKSQLLIYAVTDRAWTGKMSLYEQTEAALKGGATMVQLREKGLRDDNVEEYLEEAKKMRALTEKYNVPLLIDDNIKLAGLCGADGVHVGQNDMDAGLARKLLGPDKILGVTAKTVEQALKAQSQGADYLGSGAVFGTSTKKDARPMTMEQLQAICASVKIPVVAIGGICLDILKNCREAVQQELPLYPVFLQQKILKGLPEPFVKKWNVLFRRCQVVTTGMSVIKRHDISKNEKNS